MCSMSVLKCPLCAQTSFPTIDALRGSLIKAANGPLACPICHELFLGLDKLTIHLFSHTNNTTTTDFPTTTTTITAKKAAAVESKTTDNAAVVAAAAASSANPANSQSAPTTKRPSKEKKSKKPKQVTDAQKVGDGHAAVYAANGEASQRNGTEPTLSTCDICEFTFRDDELRDMHFRLVHQNLCNGSDKSASSQAADAAQSEPEFKCHLCAKTFKMKGSLRVHLKVVHFMSLSYVGNSTKLSICDRIRHKEAKNVIKPVGKSESQVAASTTQLLQQQQQQEQAQQVAPQLTNGFTFGTLTLLPAGATAATGSLLNVTSNGELVHAADGGPLNSNVVLVFNTSAATTLPAASTLGTTPAVPISTPMTNELEMDGQNKCSTDNPKIWECDVCSKSFTTKYFLKKHKRLHTGEMPYTCEICARTFTFQQSYHKHLLYHSNEKPHVCSTCGRAFKELSTLHNHERIHSGEKPFKCEVCGKCFRQRVSFLVHTRIHTGVMPYKCDVCQKSFRYKVSQRTHKCQPLPEPSADKRNSGAQCKAEAESTDHISESFIKAFLESTSAQLSDSQNSPASAEIAGINTADCNGNVDEALLSKTIDDIVVESCNRMGIGSEAAHSHRPSQARSPFVGNEGSNSPSQQLQNMRLYSPQLVPDMGDAVDGVDAIFPRYLLEDVGNGLL